MSAPTPVPVKSAAPAQRTSPTSVFTALQREVDRLFEDFGRQTWSPFSMADVSVKMDVVETKDGVELTAELPGMEEKDVQVTLSDRILTISGEKRAEKEEKDKNYYFSERSYGSFSRSVELPSDIEADKISAVFAKGILKVTVPTAAKPEAKKIEVKTAA
jgi:HSP20 family protein